jgi:hypothetical protein
MLILTALAITGGIAGSLIEREYNLIDYFLYQTETNMAGLDSNTYDKIIENCNTTDRIDKRLECVMTHVNRFYHYKIRNDSEIINNTQLFMEGGDCGNWALFWETVGREFGFEIDPIRIGINETTSHRFSILSSREGYCVVEQTDLDCFIYG